ncbi:MAG: hypothetical protein RL324_1748, partial [Verrucomicrobiota bacterium]
MEIKITVALALAAFASAPVWGQTGRISSISVSRGVVTLTERIGTAGNAPLSVGDNRAGLAYAAGNIPGASDTSISLFTLTGAAIPGGVTNPADVFTITAQGTATSYSASPLPAGLSINTSTGALTGTPTTVGVTSVLLGATNTTGTGNATLTVTVVAAGVAPIITNSPLTSAGTVGTPFGFSITASGLPTSYTATPLPAGLSIVGATGVITG